MNAKKKKGIANIDMATEEGRREISRSYASRLDAARAQAEEQVLANETWGPRKFVGGKEICVGFTGSTRTSSPAPPLKRWPTVATVASSFPRP